MAKWKKLKRLYDRLQQEREADSLDRWTASLATKEFMERELSSLTVEQLMALKSKIGAKPRQS